MNVVCSCQQRVVEQGTRFHRSWLLVTDSSKPEHLLGLNMENDVLELPKTPIVLESGRKVSAEQLTRCQLDFVRLELCCEMTASSWGLFFHGRVCSLLTAPERN